MSLPRVKQHSSVLENDGFCCFCPEEHSFVPGTDGRPLGCHSQPVCGKYGDVPRLKLQLFRGPGCLDYSLIWMELHHLWGSTAFRASHKK